MSQDISRRSLLAAAAASPFVSSVAARAQDATPDADKVGFAIVGLGNYSMRQMLPRFKDTLHCKPTALVTGDPDGKGRRVAGQYGIADDHVMSYEDMGKLAEMDDVQVVYVVTPTGLHLRDTLAGFAAGKHVLCEKPMATDVDECNQMIEAGKAAGKQLMIAYRVRYEPVNGRAIEYAREETLGPVRMINGEIAFMNDERDTWRKDPKLNGGQGGPLWDLGIYMVQAHRYIAGEEPVRVSGQLYRPENDPRFPEGVDSRVTWQFEFPSGKLAVGANSWDCGPTNRYTALCADGQFELDGATGYGGKRMFAKGRDLNIEEGNQFAAELDHMAECVRENKTPHTPGEEGRQDVHLMMKICEAAREGRTLEVENLRDA